MSITKKLLNMRNPSHSWEDVLEECYKIDSKFEVLSKWVSEYIHVNRVDDYGSLEQANEMEQFLKELETK